MSSSPSDQAGGRRVWRAAVWPPVFQALSSLGPGSDRREAEAAIVAGLMAEEAPWLSRLQGTVAALRACLGEVFAAAVYAVEAPNARLCLVALSGPVLLPTIGWGEGVVGAAARDRSLFIVAQMHAFRGYRAPYGEIRAEVAVPVVRGGWPLGVLDVTSRREARFGALEADFLQRVSATLAATWPASWSGLRP